MFFKLFLLFLIPLSLYAEGRKLFRASYVSFYIEGDWTCKNFYVEWVCHHRFSEDEPPAFILIEAEEAKPNEKSDDSSIFLRFQSRPKALLHSPYPRKLRINRLDWVEDYGKGQFPLELYNRLEVVTVCCDLGPEKARVSVSFQAHTENSKKYAAMFSNVIGTLLLDKTLTKELVENIRQYGSQSPQMMDYIQQVLSGEWKEEEIPLEGWEKWELLLRGLLEIKGVRFVIFCFMVVFVWQVFFRGKHQKKLKRKKIKRRRSREGSNRDRSKKRAQAKQKKAYSTQ